MNSKKKYWIKLVASSFIVFCVLDIVVFRLLMNYGLRFDSKEVLLQRHPMPYIEFSGKPFALDHNEFGYRGKSVKEASDSAFRILFFSGSVGYFGNPSIPELIEHKLEKLTGREIFIANCSVVSSNHNQHIHALIEQMLDFNIDMVLFYGGYNENIQPLDYDPRPGYPFNYLYRNECPAWKLFLLKYSALIGELEKRTGLISGKRKLMKSTSEDKYQWYQSITNNYISVLGKANTIVSGSLKGHINKIPVFAAFYQPYIVPKAFQQHHDTIRKKLNGINYCFDVSDCLDSLAGRQKCFLDNVHVTSEANEVVAEQIALVVNNILNSKNVK
jgi:hypothetical protein